MTESEIIDEWEGEAVRRFRMRNRRGMIAEVMTWGGVLARLQAPEENGLRRELVLGFREFSDYPAKSPFFGATIGRFGNRIGGAKFELDGRRYQLVANERGNQLHGGPGSFGRRNWQGQMLDTDDGPSVLLQISSKDGDQGFPGDLNASCTYTLRHDNALAIEMTATTTLHCPVNLVHHSYWNLDGTGLIDEHRLRLFAERYLPTDGEQIPTGEKRLVEGTEFDFRSLKILNRYGPPHIDFAFLLGPPAEADGLAPAAELVSTDGRCRMRLETDQPAVQCYTSFKLDAEGARGERFRPRSGICLETQAYPDAPNQPSFPSSVLQPGEVYRHRMLHRFCFD